MRFTSASILVSSAAGLLLLWTRPASAALRVVGSISTLASLGKEVGGDRIDVVSLGRGYEDPHSLEPRPSFSLQLNHADLLIHVGADLEMHWLPAAILDARNPTIRNAEPGKSGLLAASPLAGRSWRRTRCLDSRHGFSIQSLLWLSPANAKGIAHSDWLGFREVGYIERRPGITRTGTQLAQVAVIMKADNARMLLVESYYDASAAEMVGKQAGAAVIGLPINVGATPDATDWFTMMDGIVRRLTALRAIP